MFATMPGGFIIETLTAMNVWTHTHGRAHKINKAKLNAKCCTSSAIDVYELMRIKQQNDEADDTKYKCCRLSFFLPVKQGKSTHTVVF